MKDTLFSKSKFHWILGTSALFIAMCAAFFSVYGISILFSGAFISTVIMSSSLEIGKVVGVTFLYRYWKNTKTYLKTYLILAVLTLMVITSLGVFGYLSMAYQKSSLEYAAVQNKITTTELQKTYHQDKISAAKQSIEALTKLRSVQQGQLSTLSTNDTLMRTPIAFKSSFQLISDQITDTDKNIKDENQKIQSSVDGISKIDDQVNQLKLGADSHKDIQTFKFVADAVGMTLDKVARLFILMIIFVFDPLAIGLILAYNAIVYKREDDVEISEELTTVIPIDKVEKSIESSPPHHFAHRRLTMPTVKVVKSIETPSPEQVIVPTVKVEKSIETSSTNQVIKDVAPKKEAISCDDPFFKAYFKK
jgi:hypothetical protein